MSKRPEIGDMRVCRLADCDRWRVERFTKPLWFAFWQSQSWRVIYLPSLFPDEVRAAEYDTRERADEAMARFQRYDKEIAARLRGAWCGSGVEIGDK